MNTPRTAALMCAVVLLLTGADDCGGDVGKGGVKQQATTVAIMKCKGDRIYGEANGSGYPKRTKVVVHYAVRGPIDRAHTEEARSDGKGSWSAVSQHWTPGGPGKYELTVDTEVRGKHVDSDNDDCTRK